jgi:hypothetical protein
MEDGNPNVIQNQSNQIESIVELVLEEGMDVEDAVPETDCPMDDESSSHPPHLIKRTTVWYFGIQRVPLYPILPAPPYCSNYALVLPDNYVYDSRLLDVGLDIDSPPPRTT